MTVPMVVGVMVLGGFGAVLRYLLTTWWSTGGAARWPAATFGVNVVGSLLAGVVVGADASSGGQLVIVGGALGGLTTFSTWMVEVDRLRAEPRARATSAAMYVAASLVVGLLCVWLGRELGAAMIVA